jgi:cytochrome c556
MFRFALRALVAGFIASALVACATQESPPENPQGVVNERVAVMKSFIAALVAAGNFAQGKATAETAKAKVTAARAGAGRLSDLFPRGTALGDRGVKTSRALSTIFANRADFDAKRAALENTLAALDGALAENSKTDAAKLIAPVKSACLACHAHYRTPDEPESATRPQ